MSVSMDEINYLVWRYMQENGFPHAAYVFESECLADATNITQNQIPPGALIALLQKSLIYLNLEKSIRKGKADLNSPLGQEIDKVNQAFPNTNPDSQSEGISVLPLDVQNTIIIKSGQFNVDNFQWSPDGQKVCALESNGNCTINIAKENGEFDQILLPSIPPSQYTRSPAAISWNSTSEIVAIASDNQVGIFTLDGKLLHSVPGGATSVSFCPSQQLLVTCSKDDYAASLWEFRDNTAYILETFQSHHALVYDIAWRDEGLFATASHDKNITLCTVSGNKQVLHGHTAPLTAVSFNVSKSLLASASDDGTIRIWKDGRLLNILKGHSAGISCIKWHPSNPNIIASGSLDGTVKLWDALSGDCMHTLPRHADGVISLDIHPSGNYIVTCGKDCVFALWKIPEAQLIVAITHEANITHAAFSPSGNTLAISFEIPDMIVIDLAQYIK